MTGGTVIFTSTRRPDLKIHSPRLGRAIQFENGRYETDDPEEIAVLRRNRFTLEVELAGGAASGALDRLLDRLAESADCSAGGTVASATPVSSFGPGWIAEQIEEAIEEYVDRPGVDDPPAAERAMPEGAEDADRPLAD